MIGPMKKKVISASVTTAVILTIVFVTIAAFYIHTNNQKVKTLEIESAVVKRYVFSGDMLAGQKITGNNIKIAKVKEESAPYDSFDAEQLSDIVGRRVRVNAADKTLVTSSMLMDEDFEPNKDVRMQEYNMVTLPSNLNEGDFVDIRMRLLTGEDYVVLTGKRIEEFGASGVSSNTIFMNLNEEEIIRMSSAIIESYLDQGINLYANKYVEPTAQLYDYEHVNLVKKYNDSKYIEATKVVSGEDGETPEVKSEKILRTTEQLAEILGITTSEVKELETAIAKDDKEVLKEYENKTIKKSKSIEKTYPVRTEVANLIKNNPNILNEIKDKYNVEELEVQRITFTKHEETIPGLEGEEQDDYKSKAYERITAEIEKQKTERQQYLSKLLGTTSTTTTTNEE